MTEWKALEDAENHAYFTPEPMDISPASFTFEKANPAQHDRELPYHRKRNVHRARGAQRYHPDQFDERLHDG